DFGLYLLRFFENGQEVIIDPEFDLKKNVINGIPIVKQQDLVEHLELESNTQKFNSSNNPNFIKGDKVRIVLPYNKQEKYPEGILLENEMDNEQGERFVIFQPVENGKNLDLMFHIPSRLIEKI
ncbi:hypothetical protein, partial [Flectobacillus roseus]|uniref:hypothetical protein n=1 Tax=Flectobacillus roseus TaxID=502259 RepID=UPI0024B78518